MSRLAYTSYRLTSSLRHRLARRFTPGGLLMLTAVLASGALGLDLDQTMAYQILAFTACLLAVSSITMFWGHGRFKARRALPRLASVGQPFRYRVHVSNLGNQMVQGLELFEDLADPRPGYEEFRRATRANGGRFLRATVARSRPASLPRLPARGESEVQMEVLPLKRGPLRFRGVTVARSDPLGLVRGFTRLTLPETLTVLPRRYALPALALAGSQAYQRGGVALATAIGESEEFVSLRDYRPGDPLRHIHWPSSARTGRPIVKEFQDEFVIRHALILDTFAGPQGGEAFEEAVSVAASFACMIRTQESLLDLMFVGPRAICFTTGRGLGQAEQALEILAAVTPCAREPFSSLRLLVRQHARAVSSCVCVLLDWDEPRRQLVQELRARGLPTLVLVVRDTAPAQGDLPSPGGERFGEFHLLRPGQIAEDLLRLQPGME